METLPLDPYWHNAEKYFYDQQCKYHTCNIYKSRRYYTGFNAWLKEEYSAIYFAGPEVSSLRGLKFKSARHKTLFALKWR